ncbi:hypothetical protein GCM10025867_48850 (plasmid) [Frondihabitans sucicola]|uniref:Alternate-type signal peptide domain-containing protein n=1 Tax=Frondihabitans sucicola TaxID=1268041 RepID=A0ABN6Y6E0_9MICO|nr:hypothetical protein [Frondihabitans sucicola]BDZ52644.1 hypothetical protein GCM10025867_48850 [Frondihabitans sucicola]
MPRNHRSEGLPTGLLPAVGRILGIIGLCSLGAASLVVIGSAVHDAFVSRDAAQAVNAGPLISIVDGTTPNAKTPSGTDFRALGATAPAPGATGHYDFEVHRELDSPVTIKVTAVTDDPIMESATAIVIDETNPDNPKIVYEGPAVRAHFSKTITSSNAVFDVQVKLPETAQVADGAAFSFRPRVSATAQR